MTWINRPPWNFNVNLLPCIAAGVYYQGSGPIQPSNSSRAVRNYLEYILEDANRILRSISGNGCLDLASPYSLYLTLEIDPAIVDIGQSFRFYQDNILVNDYPINTNGSTFTLTRDEKFIYRIKIDGLSKINNYLNLQVLDIKVFICKEAEYQEENKILFDCRFQINKGPSLDISNIYIENNVVTFAFNNANISNCTCSTNCLPVSGIGIICNDQSSSVQYRLVKDRFNLFNFSIKDSQNNTKNISIGILTNAIPRKPFVSMFCLKEKQIAIIAGDRKSIYNENMIDYIKFFQVERFIENENNSKIILDWTDINISDHYNDESILPEKTYGYRIRYMGAFGSISKWSDWTISESKKNYISMQIDDEVYS